MSLLKKSINVLQVPTEPGLTTAELMLTNEDLRPVEPERRQWRWLNFVAFWIADSLNVNTWMITSSMIVDGLSWWQAWLCVWIGYTISGIFVVAMGRIATIYHIPFAVANRASFGIWGSFWPILNRAAMAVIWYGVQVCYVTSFLCQMITNHVPGQCVTLMIQAIWPSYANIPNNLPATYFSPACAIAFFVWAIVRAHGLGPIIHQPNTAQGGTLAWAFVKSIMNCIANFAALIINNPDFSRYAGKPKDAVWPQLITIPVGFAVTSFIGIMVTSSSSVIFGQAVWNPLTLLGMFLEDASSAERFGVFVIAAGFALAQLGTNIAANSVSAGTNLSALLPRFCTIRRGAYVCAAIGLAMCPWNLVASSNKFTVYLSSYSVFLSSIAGVMISDYYLVRRGYLELPALYSAEKTGPYYGTWGISWRGYTAYICGILINIVGFAGAVGAKVPVTAEYIYNINYLSGFLAFPIPCTSDTWNEVPYCGEAMQTEGKVIAEAKEVEDAKEKV
ncbi:permease for cytosine/purines, uracil, thiamine, allantoin-domain-containing protein [Aspergillus novoparasiticus]|uniref:Permease for cytosine/purines, uracil, thiamine, allantoin-domain-containing protein n=1 Tax=Aspergillus novoparasiticus TaxID=986946 RepID=A0A5N6EKP0_9EURO|nr:permease for cytosine/purines, uracil, thiamine, allantoin-domain-containing protein [Aspergillus novoparasiticus]